MFRPLHQSLSQALMFLGTKTALLMFRIEAGDSGYQLIQSYFVRFSICFRAHLFIGIFRPAPPPNSYAKNCKSQERHANDNWGVCILISACLRSFPLIETLTVCPAFIAEYE